MSAAAVAIVNAAISRTGGNTFTGTDFGTGVLTDGVEKNFAYLNYEALVTAELKAAPYSFARKVATCTLVGATPAGISDFAYKWTLPTDVLMLRSLTVAGVPLDYQDGGGAVLGVTGGTVYTSVNTGVFAVYSYRVDETQWPDDFVEGVICRLEALYLRSDERGEVAVSRDAAAVAAFERAKALFKGTRTVAALSTAAIAIINAAVARSTGNLLSATDFSDGSREANLAATNYEQVISTELSLSPYRFARKTAACTLIVDVNSVAVPPVDTSWKYQWTLPADVVILRTLMRKGSVIPYEIDQSGIVLTNYSDLVYAIYTYRASESLWPYDFKEGITRRLEAMFLRMPRVENTVVGGGGGSQDGVPIAQNVRIHSAEADAREQAAEIAFARARISHAQEEYPTDRRRFPLVAARRTGYGSCPR